MKLYRCALFSIMSRGVGAISAFLLSVAIGRLYGVQGSGDFFYILTAISGTTILTRLGLDNIIVKTVACSQKKQRLPLFIEGTTKVLTSSVVISMSIFLIFSYFIEADNEYNKKLISLFSLGLVPWSLMFICVAFIKGVGRGGLASLLEVALVPLIMLVMIFVNPEASVATAIFLYLLAVMFCCLTGLVLVGLDVDWSFSGSYKFTMPTVSKNLLAIDLCNYSMVWLPIFGLGLLGNKVDIGLYNAAARLGLITNIVVIGISTYLLPKLAIALNSGLYSKVESVCNKLVTLSSLICIPILLFLVIGKGFFLSIFGDEFVAAGNIMIFICLGQLINVLTGPVGQIILMSGKDKILRTYTYQSAALNVVLFAFLGPYFGGLGAGVASFLSVFLMNVRCWYWVKRNLGITLRPSLEDFKIGLSVSNVRQ